MNVAVTSAAVEQTGARFTESHVDYVLLPGISHVVMVYASQRLWLDWIAARFAGATVGKECRRSVAKVTQPLTSYQKEVNWIIQPATKPYELA